LDPDLFANFVKRRDPPRDQFLAQRTECNGSSRLEDTVHFREHGNGIPHITENKDTGYCIEGAVTKRQFLTGSHNTLAVRAAETGFCHHLPADVKAGSAAPVLYVFLNKEAGPAPDIEQVSAFGKGFDEVIAQMCMVFFSPAM